MEGNPTHNPSDLGGLDYLDAEEQLRRNIHGTQPLFGELLPQEEDVREGAVPIKGVGGSPDPKFLETGRLNKRLGSEPKLLFLKIATPHLSSYVRDRVLRSFREGKRMLGK